MSPIGGVGINLAVQDAVATANVLAAPLRAGTLSAADLAAVQRRRMLPTRLTQRVQVVVQNRVIRAVLSGSRAMKAPLIVRLIDAIPWLQRLPARLAGMGVRPEHVRTPAATPVEASVTVRAPAR
jgi:2-polyprenyl-6-methoxyphenol hydroxylase-like FAD-dependent oxidoreductase